MSGSIYIYSDRPDLTAEIAGWAKTEGKNTILLAANAEEAEKLRRSCCAEKIIVLCGESSSMTAYADSVTNLLRKDDAALLAVGSTVAGREFAASVAGRLHCTMVSDISSAFFEGAKLHTEKMIYGGAVSQSEIHDGFCVITVPPAVFESTAPENVCPVENLEAEADTRVRFVKADPIVKDSVDLTKADAIVSVGLGFNKKEDLKIAEDLAEVLGGAVGCTRSIAEQYHWMDSYIGMTGVTVKPKVYIAAGISGQIQHVFGIRDSKIIVAVNKDEKAPIFRAADYGIVGDLYEVLPRLTNILKNS